MRRRTAILGGLTMGMGGVARAAASPVVLELFTSQGCSSCPPADALLGVLAQRPDVIALAWHVDYWNYLGWRDPFAQRAWTDRQRAYAARLQAEVYTPALVVNGAAMMVGSDRRAVQAAIGAASPLPVAVSLRREGGALQVETGAVPAGTVVSLVTYDPEVATPVRAGENAGRRLTEYRVVRDVRQLNPTAGRLTVPGFASGQGAVLLVQDGAMRVLGAADHRPPAAG
ncbi:MAG: DUF1223 domain-containing protein [Acetobacteraceae bacterium]